MPDGIGALSHHRRSGHRVVASPGTHLFEGRQRRAGRAASSAAAADRPELPGLYPVLRVFSRRYRAPRRRIAPVRVDLADRQTAHATGAWLAGQDGPDFRRRLASWWHIVGADARP